MVNLQEFAIELRNYFKCCPICRASAKGTFSVHLTAGEKDTLTCKVCGAKWNLHIVPFRGFEWAELELTAKDGRGAEYLGRKLDKNEILSIVQKDSAEQNTTILTSSSIDSIGISVKSANPFLFSTNEQFNSTEYVPMFSDRMSRVFVSRLCL